MTSRVRKPKQECRSKNSERTKTTTGCEVIQFEAMTTSRNLDARSDLLINRLFGEYHDRKRDKYNEIIRFG
ncbi:hypothetical protein GJ496_007469 [Pomphorhynchus laevis]|nr:hypothetical protein GJ496_007469 [Pomphorhynchus laevis]